MHARISILFVAEFYDSTMTSDECTNAGPACLGCPQYDHCEQHYETEEDRAQN